MSEWIIIVTAVLLWLACGVLGCWLANRRLDQRYPRYANSEENAVFYLFAFGGVSTLLAALVYMLIYPARRV